MTIKFQPESTLQTVAARMARTVKPRDGKTRQANFKELNELYRIAYGALLTINFVGRAPDAASMVQGAMDCAEFIAQVSFPDLNAYDTIYCKLADYVNENRDD